MKIFLIILISIIAILSLILCTKIKIRFNLTNLTDEKDKYKVRIYAYNEKIGYTINSQIFNTKDKKVNNKKIKKNITKQTEKNEKNDSIGIIEKLYNIYENFLKFKYTHLLSKEFIRDKIIVENLKVDIDFGMSDAAQTGIATGAVWGILYNIFGFISQMVSIKNHKFNVNPDYTKEKLDLSAEGLVSFRVINVLRIGFYMFLKYTKVSKKIRKKSLEVV